MKTLFLGRLPKDISIAGYLSKHPEHKEYEILYITNDGQYRIRKHNNDTAISFNIEYFKSLVYITDESIESIDTTKDSISMIPQSNILTYSNINKKDSYIYIPIEKSIVVILGHYDNETINITPIIKIVNNHCSIKINNEDFTFNKIEIDYDVIKIVPNSIDIVFSDNLSHFINFNNPHNVTKEQIGLGNVDNVSDENKNLSKATILALDQIKFNIDTKLNSYKEDVLNHIKTLNVKYQNNLKEIIDSKILEIDNTIAECKSETNDIVKLKEDIKSHIAAFELYRIAQQDVIRDMAQTEIESVKDQLSTVVSIYSSNNDVFLRLTSDYDTKYSQVLANIEKLSLRIGEIGRMIVLNK